MPMSARRTPSSEGKEAGGGLSPERKSPDDDDAGSRRPLQPRRSTDKIAPLLEQYGCGPIQFSGTRDALVDERHPTFDRVIDPKKAEPRGQFEAVARFAPRRRVCSAPASDRKDV